MRRFKTGDRVTVNFWGEDRAGTVVTNQYSGIVWVALDGSKGKHWFHAESLTLAP